MRLEGAQEQLWPDGGRVKGAGCEAGQRQDKSDSKTTTTGHAAESRAPATK
jgi:hypothetical protein